MKIFKLNKEKIFRFWKPVFQRMFITIQFFDKKGLANHAAGGAYGFLLSAAPTLLLAAVFLLLAFRSSPQAVSNLIQRDIPFLQIIFNEDWMTRNIIRISRFGIPAIISLLSLIWAGGVFARTVQQGLKVIFTGKKNRNPVQQNLISLLIQFVVLLFAIGLIISSQTALFILNSMNSVPEFINNIFAVLRLHFFPFAVLMFITYSAYRIIPANPPRRISALRGALFCIIPYGITSLLLQFIISKTRYNFLYGALSDVIILMVSVYFFFIFFFLGAQLTKVIDSIDMLLFSNLFSVRREKESTHNGFRKRLFYYPDGPLAKYLRHYTGGEIIIRKGDTGDDTFFLLEGKVRVLFHNPGEDEKSMPILGAGVFFGEMGHLLSMKRVATIRAITDISVLALPNELFDEALNNDIDIDRMVIKNLTLRLKAANEGKA
ncbi:MAG: YihY/virulence factor BrkB family protein [Treponema sp.]|nr:YihY/virulence factor BrkB family protein [Treponema sp.]